MLGEGDSVFFRDVAPQEVARAPVDGLRPLHILKALSEPGGLKEREKEYVKSGGNSGRKIEVELEGMKWIKYIVYT